MRRISRPLLDRMDLCVEAPPVGYRELVHKGENENSETIRARVEKARKRQAARFAGTGIFFNSRMSGREVKKYCVIPPEEEQFLKTVFEQKGLSARSYHRILKVARTIADLRGSETIGRADLAEAVSFRGPEEKFWR